MRAVRVLLAIAAGATVLYGFVTFFLGELGGGGARVAEPAGVLFAAPPGYEVERGGELPRADAAARLAKLLAARPGTARLGLHFTSDGFEIYWLVERPAGDAGRIVELAAGPTGTRVETLYPGALAARLAWAADHGRFDAPGTPPAESRNLYH